MNDFKILNLGAGVQSGAIYCLMADGEIPPADYALFADTQDEPKWVYEQLEYLKQQNGPPIIEVTAGKISDDLKAGIYTRNGGTRFASIPAHTTYQEGVKGGLTRRQCTREYKIAPIEKWIRRELLKLKPKQRIPKHVSITNLFGFSTDEAGRATRMSAQYRSKGIAWEVDFPLFQEDILMTRQDCKLYIEKRAGFVFRSSRCAFCPLQGNSHWAEIKEHDPEGFLHAIATDESLRDESLRDESSVVNNGIHEIMYVHRSCVPLDEATLDAKQGKLFIDDNDGCDQGCFL